MSAMKMPTMTATLMMGVMLVATAHGFALRDIARDVKSDRVDLDAGLRVTAPQPPRGHTPLLASEAPAGGALDLFYRFGFYSLSIRVVPRDDPGTWLVREPTVQVFDDASLVRNTRPGPDTLNNQRIQLFLCQDVDELYEAYFRDFAAEGVVQPHKLFTGSWRTPIAAKYLGLTPEALTGDSSFVLVKLARVKGGQEVGGDLRLKPEASLSLAQVQSGSPDAVQSFIQQFGSHFIKDILIGDVIYQVLAVAPDQFHQLQRVIGNGINTISLADWASVRDLYLGPGRVRESGQVKAASGDVALQKFLDQQFNAAPSSLVDVMTANQNTINVLEQLTSDSKAVIGLNLVSLRSFVLDPQSRHAFDQAIGAQSSLFEVNVK